MLMQVLPDPRLVPPPGTQPLPAALRPFLEEGLSESNGRACVIAIERLLEHGENEEVRLLLAWRGPPAMVSALRHCVQAAVDGPADTALRAQIFAIPVVIVVGLQAPAEIAMVLSDMEAVQGVFRTSGCLGPSEHFALSAALCDAEALDALSPVDLYRHSRLRNESHAPLALPAAPASLPVPGQSVHLRFLVGTTMVARGAPSFCETAGETGRWGASLTREITVQLRQGGVTLLPLARAPQGLYRALTSGRYCREEMAFQLAVSDSLRVFRSRVGDPRARLYASNDDSAAVELSSPWDSQIRTHHWRLHPEDDWADVTRNILSFLKECRLSEVRTDGP